MKISITKVEVPANEVLGTKAKTLNYVVFETDDKTMKNTMNIGDKSIKTIEEMIDDEIKR